MRICSILLVALGVVNACTTNVTHISACPALTPRDGPKNVHDLRVDDIKVVGALGDSFTAGFRIMSINHSLPASMTVIQSLTEYRGLSYSSGGDLGAFTIPNYIRHYQKDVTGYSVGNHTIEYCRADNCTGIYQPDQDSLNSALSGAIAMNLDHELDYLIGRMQSLGNIDFENDWKMINIQIGTNDMCGACNSTYMDEVTPEKYGDYVEKAVKRIHANVPKVLVNLIGVFNVSQMVRLSAGQAYCANAKVDRNNPMCLCGTTPEGLATMDKLVAAYNTKLYNIYERYQHKKHLYHDFALVYQQSNFNISDFPIDFLSNLDCFHASLKGHQWVSKALWNQLFLKQSYKPKVFNFNANETICCPADSDIIATD